MRVFIALCSNNLRAAYTYCTCSVGIGKAILLITVSSMDQIFGPW
jgi:hypothetical protein